MYIAPNKFNMNKIALGSQLEPSFQHSGKAFWKSDYATKEKLVVAGTTALGVTTSLLALSKYRGYKLNPKSFWNYINTTKIKATEVVSMGLGTCLGGLAGGYIIDKNPANRRAKRRETVMQIGNISIPILTVDLTDRLCNKLKVSEVTTKGKVVRAVASIGAIIAGIYIANFAMNKISNALFKDDSNERGIKGTDLFPHVDDLLASAQYIDEKSNIAHKIARIVPLALMVPGNEIGNKKAD
jgi:hypothetical protein